ncbi:hypothetical protein M3B42_19750 [Sphingobacterium hotanense]|nr:hypothetical protein [Sphingobacterium hotanense]
MKELDLTEGKATGIPIIKKSLLDNGSPEATFETNEDRSHFQVILRIHPEFAAVEDSLVKDDTVDDVVVEGAIEGTRPDTKRKLAVLLQAIFYNEKKRVPDYSKITVMTPKTE